MFAAFISIAALMAVSAQDTGSTQSNVVQNTANIAAGERLTIRHTETGIEAVEVADAGPEQALERAGPQATPNSMVQTPPGTMAFSLGAVRGAGSVLMVENATDSTIAYDLYIVRYIDGRAHGPHRTNVCTVPSGLAVLEHWPEPVIQAVVGNVRKVEGDAPVCEPQSVAE